MVTRRKKSLWLSRLLTLLIVGILLMLNVISTRHFFRLDLTQNGEFSISSATRLVLEGLDDIVTIKVFFSEELPPNLVAVRQYLEDVLNEFQSYAQGNLQVRFLDPAEEAVAEEAKALGIPVIRMNILSKDKFEVKNGFLGVAFLYADRNVSLPVLESMSNLEYDLISAIRKVTQKELKEVAFLKGHYEYPTETFSLSAQEESYTLARAALEKNYSVSSVSLEKSALEDIQTLIIGGPELAFTDSEKMLLDQYLMRGGNLIFLLDGVDTQGFSEAKLLSLGLNDLLEVYGVRVEPKFVLDSLNEIVSLDEGSLHFTVPYPFWVKAVSDYFDPKSPILSKLQSLIFPWVSPLQLDLSEGVQATTLIQSSPEAWVQEEPFNLDPVQNAPTLTASYPLAVLLEGKFKSPFASPRNPRDFVAESNGKGRLIVIGNSRFLTNRMVKQYKQNLTFFLNTVDYLTLDQDLIGIRSKEVMDRSLVKLSDNERTIVKTGGTFLIPALVLLYSFLHFFERRKKKIKL